MDCRSKNHSKYLMMHLFLQMFYKTKTKTITCTLDRDVFEPKEICSISYSSLDGENLNYKEYHNDNGSAVIIKDFNGKVLEERFIVNGNEMFEFEFEVLKATKN